MKRSILSVFLVFVVFLGVSFADEPIPITAEQAFDSVQTQTDPISGEAANVALVDVRTRAEYYWVGAACQVDEIIKNDNESLFPNYGKVLLIDKGRFLEFYTGDQDQYNKLKVSSVSKIILSPIAINIPYKYWNEGNGTLYLNNKFRKEIEGLSSDYDVLIFFCRSGGRSQDCVYDDEGNPVFDTTLFSNIYEIDQPDGKSGRGGFEGTSYSNVYNGYRGFPERLTEIQDHPSVSWKDTGLPMKTSVNPLN